MTQLHSQHSTRLDGSTLIWRYMDLGEFLTLCCQGALNLAPVLAMPDTWEGILPRELDSRHPFFQKDDVKKVGDGLYVSCWHMNPAPNAAMWGLYSNRRGVAVQSTVGRLLHSVKTAGPGFWMCPINYSNYDFTGMDTPDMTPIDETSKHEDRRFTFKRQEYAFERELRVMRIGTDELRPGQMSGGPDMHQSSLPVDFKVLIESLHVHPDTEPWVFSSILNVFKNLAPGLCWKHVSNMATLEYKIRTGLVVGEDSE